MDGRLRAGERLWAIGDVNGIWPLTHVGEYEATWSRSTSAAMGARRTRSRPARHLHRSAGRGGGRDGSSVQRHRTRVRGTEDATYTHAYAESNGFLTLLSDGQRLTGAYALGPKLVSGCAGHAGHPRPRPLEVLSDTIQPFPSFSSIYDGAVKTLRMTIADQPRPASPMDPQMAPMPG